MGLEEDLANSEARNRKLEKALKKVRSERQTIADGFQDLEETFTTYRERFEGSASGARIRDLEKQIRERDHAASFRDAALSKGVDPRKIGDLYRLSGLDPHQVEEGEDDLDEAGRAAALSERFGAYLDEAKTSREWAFTPAKGGTEQPAPDAQRNTATRPPGPGASRGASAPTIQGKSRFTRDQIQDPEFYMKNADAIHEDAAAGLIKF